MRSKINNITYRIFNFFPIQLLILHFKKNQILLFFWFILFLTVTGNFASGLGVPYLFLDPEYLNTVSFPSMLIMGVSYSIFSTAFFITTYILDSHRFNFLGTVKRPFSKYSLNNSLIPLIFMIVYIWNFVAFQKEKGLEDSGTILIQVLGFMAGFWVWILIVFTYFRKTNRDLFKTLAKNLDRKLKNKKINVVQVIDKIDEAKKNRRNYRISSYLDLYLRFRKVDDNAKYDKTTLLKVFDQHHINAVSVEIFIFAAIMVIGLFRDNPSFQIPAAASGLLLFSFLVMFIGAFSYWLRGWAITGMFILLICYNYAVKNNWIDSEYRAFGINYETEKVDYSLNTITSINSDKNYKKDYASTVKILENWKTKNDGPLKPKMVIITASGGGQRAAVWATRTLQNIDKNIGGGILDRTVLITGASGGLVGCSYYRELFLRNGQKDFKNILNEKHVDNISKDILNPMIFSLVVSDIFLRFQKFEYEGRRYYKGRGYAFEKQLQRNLGGIFDKKVVDYKNLEQKAQIPMVFMSPVIINDARKMYISPQRISYMTRPAPGVHNNLTFRDKGVEFMRLFEKQDAEKLKFTTAMRMSSTFPYITPNITLPSEPKIEVMDAGLADNYGISDALRFIHTFKDWILENTDGVVIISIRDTDKNPFIKTKVKQSMWSKLLNPLKALTANWDHIQDQFNDDQLVYTRSALQGKLDLVAFQYVPQPKGWEGVDKMKIDFEKFEDDFNKERASLSWHLTKLEKESLRRTVNEEINVNALNKLKNLLRIEINQQ